MDAGFVINGVKKSYAGRRVLDIDHLDIVSGEMMAILGPSGAGKSTLLRLLNFLEFPDEGQVRYGSNPNDMPAPLAVRRQITTVFQRPALIRGSVEDNVKMGLQLRGQRGGSAQVLAILERLGLASLRKAPAHTLSGGEMQRVSLARALVIEPRVLLLDEPTANLDPYHVGLIEEVVSETNRQRGTTVVLVTHNVFQARRIASQVALLLNGQVVETGPSESFFESPANERTRAFVRGEMIY